MKKLVFGLMMVPVVALAEMKLATVDVLVLVRNHPDYDRNEKFMESKSKDLEKKVQAIKSEGEALQAEGKLTIYRLPDEDIRTIQQVAKEYYAEKCESNPLFAKIYNSQMAYIESVSSWSSAASAD